MFGHWINKVINGASNIYRWQGKEKIKQRNDAEHMWSVAIIAEGLARIEKDNFNNDVNVEEVLKKAIFHDCLETETGDISSGVKRKTESMKKALEEVEKIYYEENLCKLIPKKWRDDYSGYLLNPKDNLKTIEGKIIAVADSIDALNECIKEVKLGNNSFKPYLETITKDILSINLDSGKYFIKYCLIDFDLPISEYGQEVRRFINVYEFDNI